MRERDRFYSLFVYLFYTIEKPEKKRKREPSCNSRVWKKEEEEIERKKRRHCNATIIVVQTHTHTHAHTKKKTKDNIKKEKNAKSDRQK